MDEKIRQERYRCEIDELKLGDLCFKAVNPAFNRQVSLKKGEYLLTELLDFADLKRSRLMGSLKGCIDLGWVSIEVDEVVSQVQSTSVSIEQPAPQIGIDEVHAGIVAAKDLTDPVREAVRLKDTFDIYPKDTQPKIVEVVSAEKSRTVNSFAVEEPRTVATLTMDKYEEFTSLRYFQKLKTIKDTKDSELLRTIVDKSNYPQLVHNAKARLKEVQCGNNQG